MACGEPGITKVPRNVAIRRAIGAVLGVIVFCFLFYGLVDKPEKQAQCRLWQYKDENRFRVEYWEETQNRWIELNVYTKLEHAENAMKSCIYHYDIRKNNKDAWQVIEESY